MCDDPCDDWYPLGKKMKKNVIQCILGVYNQICICYTRYIKRRNTHATI